MNITGFITHPKTPRTGESTEQMRAHLKCYSLLASGCTTVSQILSLKMNNHRQAPETCVPSIKKYDLCSVGAEKRTHIHRQCEFCQIVSKLYLQWSLSQRSKFSSQNLDC